MHSCNLIVYQPSQPPQQVINYYDGAVLAGSPEISLVLATRTHYRSYNDNEFLFVHSFKVGHSVEQLDVRQVFFSEKKT